MFVRGFLAEKAALDPLGVRAFEPIQSGGDRVLPPFEPDCATQAALGIVFTGRRAPRADSILVVVGRRGLLFPSDRVGLVALDPGVLPIRVPQSRVGVNAGAITLAAGEGLIIEYRVNIWGPPGGAFITQSQVQVPCAHIQAYAAQAHVY